MTSLLSKAGDIPGLFVSMIIRPPRLVSHSYSLITFFCNNSTNFSVRAKYEVEHLGPTKFTVNDRVFERIDIEVIFIIL